MTIDEAHEIINARPNWLKAFQKYCDSEQIQKESEINGINACGYGIQCDYCDMKFGTQQCARAMENYMKRKRIAINYLNSSKEYFHKLLEGETE